MKQIKSLNSFLAQNVLKLTSFHSLERAREKINTFFTFQVVKIPATTHILGQNYEFPDFSLTSLVFKISLTNLQNSLTFPWSWRKSNFPDFSLTIGHPELDKATTHIILSKQWTTKVLIRLRGWAGWSAPLLFAYGIWHIFAWPGPNLMCYQMT